MIFTIIYVFIITTLHRLNFTLPNLLIHLKASHSIFFVFSRFSIFHLPFSFGCFCGYISHSDSASFLDFYHKSPISANSWQR
jgi:hypothetical protein